MIEPLREHLNTGAPFMREDGSRWERGAVHVPSPRELRQRRYKLRPTDKTAEPAVPVRDDGWTLSMEPRLYLELHPTGSHAPLARELTGLEEIEEVEAEEEDTDGTSDD